MSEQRWTGWQGPKPLDRKAVQGAGLIAKACDVLDIVGGRPGGITAAEMIDRTRMPRATLYRILAALATRGLIQSDPVTEAYTLGFRFLEYAQNVWASPDIVSIAAIELKRLRDATGETAYLAVLHHRSALTLGKFEGAHEYRSLAPLGTTKPLHCTSQGKAILAFMPDPKVETLLGKGPLARFTERTITDRVLLRAQLNIIRCRGYAIDDEEILPGIRCVGAPIIRADGPVTASISVAGPSYRLTSDRAEQLGPELIEATRRIGAQLGSVRRDIDQRDQNATVVAASDTRAFEGMAPLWVAQAGALVWADKFAPSLHISRERESMLPLGERSSAVDALLLSGNEISVLIGGRVVSIRDGAIRRERVAPALSPIRILRTDPNGIPWAAALSDGATVIGRLTDEAQFVAEWPVSGNVAALAWAPDGACLYAAEPERGVILAFGRGARAQRVFARIPKASGMPVGLAADAEGRLWMALRDGWSVARLNRDGEIDHVIALPVPRPTDLAFGGPRGMTLYVATASIGLPLEMLAHAPLSGQLLAVEAGVRGHIVPPARYPL